MSKHEVIMARRKAADRERKRLAAERQQRMRGASQRWTQHVRNAIHKRYRNAKRQ